MLLEFPGRSFELKAKNSEERDQWIQSLMFIKANFKIQRMEREEATPKRET